MLYVILGMHKSGTTLVSQILHHSGISMGDLDLESSYDAGNKYECQEALRLNMTMLGVDHFGVLEVPRERRPGADAATREAMAAYVARRQAAGGDWGFKDPRTCLTYTAWRDVLPEHRIIAVYRDPARIWPRFKWQGRRLHHTNFARAAAYLRRWHEHNLAIADFLEQTGRDYFVCDYHDFMSGDGPFARLQEFVGRPLDDRRVPGLYRSRDGSDLFLRGAEAWLGTFHGLRTADTTARLARLVRP